MIKKTYSSINEYLELLPEEVQKKLNHLISLVHKEIPEIKDKISYGILTFTLNGKNIIHLGCYKAHIGIYPGSRVIEEMKDELQMFETSKGTIKIPLDQKISDGLFVKILKNCLNLNSSH